MENQGDWGYQGMVILVSYGHHLRPLPIITKQRSSKLSGGFFQNNLDSTLLPSDTPNASFFYQCATGLRLGELWGLQQRSLTRSPTRVKPVLESTCERYNMGSLRLSGDEPEAWIELERKHMAIGAIAEDENLWCSVKSCFLFPKSSGGYRLIVDNQPFNDHNVQYPTELDTLHTLSTVLRPNDLLSAFDLQDEYFHFAIHPEYQKYFGFRVNGKGYRMVGLPFGCVWLVWVPAIVYEINEEHWLHATHNTQL
jgi:hypothetical protein